jgi:GH24 family phage-related lysozyme (muramidase)
MPSYLDLAYNTIRDEEGFKAYTYDDATGKPWPSDKPLEAWTETKSNGSTQRHTPTIGHGLTKGAGKKAQTYLQRGKITKDESTELALGFVQDKIIPKLSKNPWWEDLNDEQKVALISYGYNVGPNFLSTHTKLKAALDAGDLYNAALNMDAGYNNTNYPGLRKRRDREREMFYPGFSKAYESTFSPLQKNVPGLKEVHAPWKDLDTTTPYNGEGGSIVDYIMKKQYAAEAYLGPYGQ